MGAKGSRPSGRLSSADVERLQRRFMKLAGPDGRVAIPKFQSMVELGANPFTGRILQLFDTDNDNHLTLDEFTKAMDYFGELANPEEQYKFAFKIYDMDGDGFIGAQELYQTLSTLVGRTIPDAHLEQIALNTMREYDVDGDDKLSLHEFKNLLSTTDLQHKFSLSM
ncbi:hypothetical protein DUNSADRAFT_16889 [Dunaliella salina]|uniref:EF-hand domain-containing protein n=1 Tax=Dunaliella salina TaxID=3046 RepID=A0ABQ7H963_DUNSA|nr:hypothetical protein DUNSADRAFT_16889 [Dunaliella salina]|eukprot:KAF5843390.1 hypothetical protein DUNSADRAFT_16889 [Dunaliella salina]